MQILKNFWLHHWGTTTHKFMVAKFMFSIAFRLIWRAIIHDLSKYGNKESEHFIKNIHRLRASVYGTDEYKAMCREIQPALDHHYAANSHHPEHYNGTVAPMTALDEIEMICDWAASAKRHSTGDPHKSLVINATRFSYSEDRRLFYEKILKDLGE